ncbi:MAG: metalloregulator ArsR/SmtB family transcription factor [Myxococcota bacterium]|nr:metalloregulator ArsR/SmtB family transcription factor [Myxococcota bacterium]
MTKLQPSRRARLPLLEDGSAALRALAVPSRLALVIDLVSCGCERRVSDLASSAEVSLSMVSRHLRVLEDAGLVESRREGAEVFFRVPGARLAALLRALADRIERCCP